MGNPAPILDRWMGVDLARAGTAFSISCPQVPGPVPLRDRPPPTILDMRYDKLDTYALGWAAFRDHLTDAICAHSVVGVAFEEVRFSRNIGTFVLGQQALLEVVCHDLDILAAPVNVSTLKAYARRAAGFATTDWSSSKADMRRALASCCPRCCVAAWSDDAVDATWVSIWLEETAVSEPTQE